MEAPLQKEAFRDSRGFDSRRLIRIQSTQNTFYGAAIVTPIAANSLNEWEVGLRHSRKPQDACFRASSQRFWHSLRFELDARRSHNNPALLRTSSWPEMPMEMRSSSCFLKQGTGLQICGVQHTAPECSEREQDKRHVISSK